MGQRSRIEWTEATWNPIVGCSIVSPGCTHCYAMRMAARIEAMARAGRLDDEGDVVRGAKRLAHYDGLTKTVKKKAVWTGKVALAPEHILLKPLRRRKPTMWFVNSMSDLFHEDLPDEWIDRVFAVMALCPQHTFQVLTKRSKRMRDYLTTVAHEPHRNTVRRFAGAFSTLRTPLPKDFNVPLPNVWLGVSAERQQEADERIPDLLATPAAVRFVSAEPLLGALDLTPWLTGVLDWVIVGGESGPGARPMHPDWVRSIRDQCVSAGVAFFFKQWGAPLNGHGDPSQVGAAGRLLDDREWNEMPRPTAEAGP